MTLCAPVLPVPLCETDGSTRRRRRQNSTARNLRVIHHIDTARESLDDSVIADQRIVQRAIFDGCVRADDAVANAGATNGTTRFDRDIRADLAVLQLNALRY